MLLLAHAHHEPVLVRELEQQIHIRGLALGVQVLQPRHRHQVNSQQGQSAFLHDHDSDPNQNPGVLHQVLAAE